MKQHIDLVGILYVVWGGLIMLAGTSVLILGAGAAATLIGDSGSDAAFATGVTAIAFVVLALIALAGGGIHVWAGRALRRHESWARLLVLVLGALNLFIVPFGTALGLYSLWTLLNHDVRRLFEPETITAPARQ